MFKKVIAMRGISSAHWRDSARSIRFFIWDGKLLFPMVFLLAYPRLVTLAIALVAITFFMVLNRYGFSPQVFLRWLRNKLAGSHKLAVPWWME